MKMVMIIEFTLNGIMLKKVITYIYLIIRKILIIDMFIRMRRIHINDIDKLNKYINFSYLENKLMVTGNVKKFTDIIFMESEEYFKKVIANLCDFMRRILLTKSIQNRIKKTKPSKNNLRFSTMSEILFSLHVRKKYWK